MMRKKPYAGKVSFAIVAISVWVLFLLSCSNSIDSIETDPSRIVWGEHIEGVRIGDDSTAVVQKLGPPSYMIGGDFEGWTFYYVEDTKYKNMTIKISQDSGLPHPGVFAVELWPPYDGTTKEGVGLGMPWKEALKHLPAPDSTYSVSGSALQDTYYYEKNTFFVRYGDDKIIYMMGMGIPNPNR